MTHTKNLLKHIVNYMSWPVRVVAGSTTVAEARRRLVCHAIGRLPVLSSGGELIGIVSTHDLARADAADLVREHMTEAVITTTPEASTTEVAMLLTLAGVGGLPVEVDGHVVGMITWCDLESAELPTDRPACMICGSSKHVSRSPDFFRMPLCRDCSAAEVNTDAMIAN